jgi:serine beta-lactamase-like protein LACTB
VKSRAHAWIALAVGAVGLVPAAILALFVFMTVTAAPLHPSPGGVPSVPRGTPPPHWVDAVDEARRIVRTGLSEHNLPGMSVAVGVDGEIVWAEGFGWANLEKRVPVAPDTRFRIGTASTVLTSAAVGLLVEKHRLALNDRIQTYVPDFPEKQWPVTLRQLMGHVAGIGTDGGDEGPLFGVQCQRAVDALEYFKDPPLLFEPGTDYRYSSYGWILVSAAVEDAAHEPFLSFMRKEIFQPLGMDHTEADSATESIPDRATPYFPRFVEEPRYGPELMRDIDYSCYAGSSVFVSTPSDLVRFAIAIDSGRLLQPATVRSFQASQKLASGRETGYGLGWDLETVAIAGKQAHVIGHDGMSLGGMLASLMTFPEHRMVVAVTSNISYADTFGVGTRIAEAFAQHPGNRARK